MKRNRFSRYWYSVALALAGAGLTTYGLAAAADTESQESSNQAASIQTIVVTAQRRTQNLQDVPVSVQVFTEKILAEKNLISLPDLNTISPSLLVLGSGRSSFMYIRGIGSGNNQAFDQSVGMFIDDIYHGRSRMGVAAFLDLDRVEVLKGPQSTYFGNNAIAGAFNLTTQKPSNEFDASARTLYGRDGEYTVEAAVGGPITDTISGRAAILANGLKGWMQDVNSGTEAGGYRNRAGRMTLMFKPSKDIDATLKIEGGNDTSGARPVNIVKCPPPAPYTVSPSCQTALNLGLPIGLASNKNAESPGQGTTLDTQETVLTLNYRNWGHTFTSVSGYYDYDFNINLDSDSLPAVLVNVQAPERYHQFSQEFRVASPSNQPIEYLAGIYYQTSGLDVNQNINFDGTFAPVVKSTPAFASLIPFLPLAQLTKFKQNETSTSAFGSLSWNATDRLKVIGGLRVSSVKKDMNQNISYGTDTRSFGGFVPLPASVVTAAGNLARTAASSTDGLARTDHASMPSASIQYKLAPASMAYASYAKGFKAGGFNGTEGSGVAARFPFAPEHVDAYEFGLKNKWDKLLLNASLFRSNYSDLQTATSLFSSAGTLINVVSNAANARSQGIELEGQWVASSKFRLTGNLTYLDAKYGSNPGQPVTVLQRLQGLTVQDLSGKTTPYSPKWSGSLTGTYSTLLPGSEYRITSELSTIYSSSYNASTNIDPLFQQDGYVRLDGRLTLEIPNGRWAFDLIGKNLNDRNIVIFGANQSNFIEQKQRPRSLAVQARYRY